MSRPLRDPRASVLLQQRRMRAPGDPGEEVLDLFSRNRRSVPVSSDDADRRAGGLNRLGSAPVDSGKLLRGGTGIDDLLSGSDMGKHDYDWLLTPPGTPLRSSMDSIDQQQITVAQRGSLSAKPSITVPKASRFSMPQPDNTQQTRPTRSNSLTRSAVSAYSSHFSNSSIKTSALNTSTASVTSCRPSTPTRPTTSTTSCRPSTPTRPATPTKCSTPVSAPTSSVPKQTTPVPRTVTSRPSTPAKTRPIPTSPVDKPRASQTASEKPRSLHSSRPSTPTSRSHVSSNTNPTISVVRPQTPVNLNASSNSVVSRSSSRPSTPTRRTLTPCTPSPRSSSVGRVSSMNSRNSGPPSRPSSPGPKPRPTVPSISLPDFPLDAPPNLRTKMPERPTSAGRTRPGAALTIRSNLNFESPTATNASRRQSSPIVSRGRFPENSPRSRTHSNGHEFTPPDMQKITVSDGPVRKPAKTAGAVESTGFGRTISKKSLDMALRHMDIRQGMGSIRGASLFPQSIRASSTTPKGHPARRSDSLIYPSIRNGNDTEEVYCNGTLSGSGSANDGFSENDDGMGFSSDRSYLMTRAMGPDVFESSRYDTILLKEDSKNMNWLHSIEDKSDQGSVFDHRFEPLPEPFGLI